ncbi:biopolymer transporter ExbD [Thiomicrorhabdus sp. zzn3]|uniref:ExbD/TolR family protein n=1 Tax=Thiomicrorhabdus sp. zzn3 TaxID=3039775 RepID=UPI002436645E|nr:biopolymer transporter ExbD [Thiomicrorhabdus sp. zzn3]MDG6778392.1 biopolymer transporter ExbD [Thiomicrorhabdus sp. zzn3]
MSILNTLTLQNRLSHKRDKPSADIESNLVPMINIVFLLLIFFMISGQIHMPLEAKIALPQSQAQAELTQGPLQLSVTLKRELRLNGEPLALQQLSQKLQSGFKSDAPMTLQIYADSRLKMGELLPILSELSLLDVNPTIQLVTQQPLD